MSVTNESPLSRKRLRIVVGQLAHDRKLDILSYAAEHDEFSVADLKTALDLPHTSAHEYCRDLTAAGLLERKQGKPARYTAVEFDIHLSLNAIQTAVEMESETLEYATKRYGDDVIDEILDVWDRVENGDLTYREASAKLKMDHVDFLRTAVELGLLDR
jgi:DNA-binding transcriptional ArsR family regulator